MKRWSSVLIFAGIIGLSITPFVRDAWAWYEIRSHLSLTAQQVQALNDWQGSPQSFVAMLHDQCLRENPGSEHCRGYR